MRKILDDMQIRTVATNDPVVHNNMEFFSTFFANKNEVALKKKSAMNLNLFPMRRKI